MFFSISNRNRLTPDTRYFNIAEKEPLRYRAFLRLTERGLAVLSTVPLISMLVAVFMALIMLVSSETPSLAEAVTFWAILAVIAVVAIVVSETVNAYVRKLQRTSFRHLAVSEDDFSCRLVERARQLKLLSHTTVHSNLMSVLALPEAIELDQQIERLSALSSASSELFEAKITLLRLLATAIEDIQLRAFVKFETNVELEAYYAFLDSITHRCSELHQELEINW